MALFKTRKGGDEPQATHRQPESVEAIRTRARHRLIGAGVLVLIAIIGFPVLFDTQPRPVAVDIPIQIPDRNKAKPLAPPAVSGPVTGASSPAKVAAVTSPAPAPAVQAEAAPEPKPQIRNESKAEVKSAAAKPEPKPDEGNKARALLEGKPVQVAAAGDTGRYVVQVGAFADAGKAREARMKVERAGLKTYTQVAETSDGKRTRVRVGPFGTRAEADKAAGKIKGLDLPAAILSL
jgi:DedD protein